MDHVIDMDGICHIYERVMSLTYIYLYIYIRIDPVIDMPEICHIHETVMSCVYEVMSYVYVCMNGSSQGY